MDGDKEDLEPDELLELIQADDAKDTTANAGDGNRHQSSEKTMENSGRRKSAPPPRFVEQADRIMTLDAASEDPRERLIRFWVPSPKTSGCIWRAMV